MPHDVNKTGRELVLPNRDKLRSLRDQYMRDLEAFSYDEVRNKFLQELKLKHSAGEAEGDSAEEGPRERGAGIWNKAFARDGRMYRSSIVLLAEFFDVAPEELIMKPGPDDIPQTEEVKPMPDLPLEPAMESLVAFWQRSPKLDIQLRHLCQQLTEHLQRHSRVPLSEFMDGGSSPNLARLREAILQLIRVEPGVHTLVLRISRMSSPEEQPASKAASPIFHGDHNQVVTVQGDIHLSSGSLFNNQNTFNIGSGKKGGTGSSDS